MVDIELISLSEKQPQNSFMAKMERISREDQRLLYLKSMQVDYWEDLIVLHSKAFKSNSH
jgi:hypothetical protein